MKSGPNVILFWYYAAYVHFILFIFAGLHGKDLWGRNWDSTDDFPAPEAPGVGELCRNEKCEGSLHWMRVPAHEKRSYGARTQVTAMEPVTQGFPIALRLRPRVTAPEPSRQKGTQEHRIITAQKGDSFGAGTINSSGSRAQVPAPEP